MGHHSVIRIELLDGTTTDRTGLEYPMSSEPLAFHVTESGVLVITVGETTYEAFGNGTWRHAQYLRLEQ